MEKLDKVANELVGRKLAVQANRSWYLVEKNIANKFMFYLASVIGAAIGYQPPYV